MNVPNSNIGFGIRIFYILGRPVYYLIEDTRKATMRIILSESIAQAAERVAETMVERIESHPTSVIGLATGNTMVPVYAAWVRLARERSIDHSRAFFFLLDEYLVIPAGHPSSFQHYVTKHLFGPLAILRSQFALPPVHEVPLDKAGEVYEKTINDKGGIDVQLLGIGVNGHIGFNEPGSSHDSRTRRVTLAPETLIANGKNFIGTMPKEALSMGIGTILESRTIILLATGKSKADAIKYVINHHDDPACPATFLKSHSHFTLVLDPEAASRIDLKI